MKALSRSFSCLIALIVLAAPLTAQEGEGYGFLNIANLIPAKEPCEIKIGGEVLAPDGLAGGDYTGWFMVAKGTRNITITSEGGKPVTGSLNIEEGRGNLIAIYLEPDKRPQPDGKPSPPVVRIRSYPTYKATGYDLKLVSFHPGENRFQLGPLKLEPEPYKAVEIPKWNGNGFAISRNGESLGDIRGASESGAFYLLLGTDLAGAHTAVLVSANEQEVPEYLRKKASDTKLQTSDTRP